VKLTPHFWLDEFSCRDGTPVPARWLARVTCLAEQLEVLRAELGGKVIKVNSGYRHPAYNRGVGGGKTSQHLYARAADIVVRGVPARKVHATILRLVREGRMRNGGVGRYATFTHYDIRPKPARWG
jgi:uncharacterized protein YcbK (DUF882 family)